MTWERWMKSKIRARATVHVWVWASENTNFSCLLFFKWAHSLKIFHFKLCLIVLLWGLWRPCRLTWFVPAEWKPRYAGDPVSTWWEPAQHYTWKGSVRESGTTLMAASREMMHTPLPISQLPVAHNRQRERENSEGDGGGRQGTRERGREWKGEREMKETEEGKNEWMSGTQ